MADLLIASLTNDSPKSGQSGCNTWKYRLIACSAAAYWSVPGQGGVGSNRLCSGSRQNRERPAFQPLVQAAHDPETRTRICAITALGEFGTSARECIADALNDPSPEVRQCASAILGLSDKPRMSIKASFSGQVLPPEGQEVKLQIPGDTIPTVPDRKTPYKDPAKFISLINSKDREVRSNAIQALADIGEP